MKPGLFVFISIVVLACATEDITDYTVKTFSSGDIAHVGLRGSKFEFPRILSPHRIILVDGYIVVADQDPKNYLHVIDINKAEYVRSLGKAGSGPGEMAGWAWRLSLGVREGDFWAYYANTKEFSLFNVEDTSRLSRYQLRQPEGDDFFLAADMVPSSDSTVMTTRTNGEEKFVEYSYQGNITKTFGTWVGMVDKDDVPVSTIAALHQGALKSNPDRSKFMYAGIMRDIMEILDYRTGHILSVRGPVNEITSFTVDYGPGYPMLDTPYDTKYYYIDSFMGKERVYGLFSGLLYSEFLDTGKFANEVYVIDYTGQLLTAYDLDISVQAITVDEKGKKIYAISYDADPGIVVFDLPK